MERINTQPNVQDASDKLIVEKPPIFGLRYLEEEATEIHDVVGCFTVQGTCTPCDDGDGAAE